MNTEQNNQKENKALHIGAVSGSGFSVFKSKKKITIFEL